MSFLSWINRVGRLMIARLLYLQLQLFLVPVLRLGGYKQSRVGSCTVLAPVDKMGVILEGITLLKTLDLAMYHRVTDERPYIVWYNEKARYIQYREYFTITDNYVSWGKEGVAVFFVQLILDFDVKYLPTNTAVTMDAEQTLEARYRIQRQVLEWLKPRSFPMEMVRQYEKFAKQPSGM